MKKQNLLAVGIIAGLFAAIPVSVSAESRAGFRLTGVVNTICRLEFPASTSPNNNIINFGTFTQLCNARSGYRVTMQHPSDLGGAILSIDGRAIQLSNSGETVIVDEDHPVDKTSFAQLDFGNIQTAARSFSFRIEPKGAVYGSNRSQANYVVQSNDAGYSNPEFPETAQKALEMVTKSEHETQSKSRAGFDAKADFALAVTPFEFTQSSETKIQQAYDQFPNGLKRIDAYDAATGFKWGLPTSDKKGTTSPTRCYGMVGAFRNHASNTSSGGEFYKLLGEAPRYLERNISLVGRSIENMEYLSSLPRDNGRFDFYEDAGKSVPITSIRLAGELPASDLPRFEYLSMKGVAFAGYADARANHRDPFFITPAGGADICNNPVPARV